MNNKHNFFCANISKSIDEQICPSASKFNKLLLIEYNDSFEANALLDSTIDNLTKKKLVSLQESDNFLKILLIKQDKKIDKIRVFTVSNSYEHIKYHSFCINNYTDLLEIDIISKFDNNDNNHEFLYLICTNGKKDKCCGKFGKLLYSQISKNNPNIWECSHMGGDRFASNVLVVPSFTVYGRVDLNIMKDIIRYTETELIYLNSYRGHSALSLYSQAAENFIRKKYNLNEINSLKLVSEKPSSNIAIVTFIDKNNKTYNISVEKTKSNILRYTTCNTIKKNYTNIFIPNEIN
jgi:hypothetical protein